MSPKLVRARTSAVSSSGPGLSAARMELTTWPKLVCASSLAAVPARMPISIWP